MIICVTGHRPDKLYGYDLTDPRWKNLKNIFKEKSIEMKCTNAISGMALGVDTIFALAVLELKKEGHPIQLLIVHFHVQNNVKNGIMWIL